MKRPVDTAITTGQQRPKRVVVRLHDNSSFCQAPVVCNDRLLTPCHDRVRSHDFRADYYCRSDPDFRSAPDYRSEPEIHDFQEKTQDIASLREPLVTLTEHPELPFVPPPPPPTPKRKKTNEKPVISETQDIASLRDPLVTCQTSFSPSTQDLRATGHVQIATTPTPQTLFLSFSLDNGLAIQTVLSDSETARTRFPTYDIHVITGSESLRKLCLATSLRTVMVLLDLDADRDCVLACIQYFLDKDLAVKIVFSESEDAQSDTPTNWKGVLSKKYGIHKAATRLTRAIPIGSIDVFATDSPPSQALNRLSRDLSPDKTSQEDRIERAQKLYATAQHVHGHIIAAYLGSRGITAGLPSDFRVSVIPHPDLTPTQNKFLFNKTACDAQEGLLDALATHPNLEGRLAYFRGTYWLINRDIRERGSVFITMRHKQEKTSLVVHDGGVWIDAQSERNIAKGILLVSCAPYSLIIPFYNAAGELTGIERNYIGPDGQRFNHTKHYLSVSTGKPAKHKLGMGLHKGSHACLYQKGRPETVLLSEGAFNALSAREALLDPALAIRLGLHDHVAIRSVMGTNNMIDMPLDACTHTVIILADNDGYNMETHQTLIDLVAHLLTKKITVKIAFPHTAGLGGKRDLNDVLLQGGIDAVGETLANAVHIRHARELGPTTHPLPLRMALLSLRDQLKDPVRPNRGLTLYRFASVFSAMGYDDMARKTLEITPSWLAVDGMSDTLIHANTLDLLGATYTRLGRYVDAHDTYHDSLTLKLGLLCTPLDRAKTVAGIGDLYLAQKKYRAASMYYHQYRYMTGPCRQMIRQPDIDRAVFFGLGDVYAAQKRYAKALACYHQGLLVHHQASGLKHQAIASGLDKLGDVYTAYRKFDKGLQFYTYALTVNTQVFCSENHPMNRDILQKMSDAHLALGHTDKARDCAVRNLKIQTSEPTGILKTLMKWKHLQPEKTPSQIMGEIGRVIKGLCY